MRSFHHKKEREYQNLLVKNRKYKVLNGVIYHAIKVPMPIFLDDYQGRQERRVRTVNNG